MKYVPTVPVFTVPDIAITTPVPSTLSVHFAHNSSYGVPDTIVIADHPLSITAGGVWSVTFTVLVTLPVFPVAST